MFILEGITDSQNINVIVGNRPEREPTEERKPTIKVIKRNNRGKLALYLPNIAVYNHRSFWKKFHSFVTESKNLQLGISLHSEIWENKENKKHKRKIEELTEMHGISYISNPRPKRRGGGSAITCNSREFYMKKVFLENPDKLEITAAIVRPRAEEAKDTAIITIAVYCPPNSKKQSKLIDYVTETYHYLKAKHPNAFFLFGGDVNSLNWKEICDISPNFRQCVTKPTRKDKTLSVIITDLPSFILML